MITVRINGEERQYPQGATYEDVANDYQKEYDNLIALAARDGKIRELFKKLTRDCEITFFTLKAWWDSNRGRECVCRLPGVPVHNEPRPNIYRHNLS